MTLKSCHGKVRLCPTPTEALSRAYDGHYCTFADTPLLALAPWIEIWEHELCTVSRMAY